MARRLLLHMEWESPCAADTLLMLSHVLTASPTERQIGFFCPIFQRLGLNLNALCGLCALTPTYIPLHKYAIDMPALVRPRRLALCRWNIAGSTTGTNARSSDTKMLVSTSIARCPTTFQCVHNTNLINSRQYKA
ncbi:hypothetical protein F5X98DRAFT_343165 [Xylaria grammica]|nr:hypothetical protein F5X98DRAFT_343165 [Xylaria grammica]